MNEGEPEPGRRITRVAAYALCIEDGRLLLCRLAPWSKRWIHPRDGVDEAYHAIQIVYRVRIIGGDLRDELDGSTDAARWFSQDQLSGLPLVELAQNAARLAFK